MVINIFVLDKLWDCQTRCATKTEASTSTWGQKAAIDTMACAECHRQEKQLRLALESAMMAVVRKNATRYAD